jgi:hypothetical protein
MEENKENKTEEPHKVMWAVICTIYGWPFCVAGIGGNEAKDLNGKPIAASGAFVESDMSDREKYYAETSSERYKWEDGNVISVVDDMPVRLFGSPDGKDFYYIQGYSSERIAKFMASCVSRLKKYGVSKCSVVSYKVKINDIVNAPVDAVSQIAPTSKNAPWLSKPCPVPRPSQKEWAASLPDPDGMFKDEAEKAKAAQAEAKDAGGKA